MLELTDLSATQRLARTLAPHMRQGDVITLKGAIGVGKTAFARALIQALGGKEEVPSPTFTLVQIYDLDRLTVWHFDLFRLRYPIDVYELGIEDAMIEGLSLIEWPEKMKPYTIHQGIEITFLFHAGETRKVTITPHGTWRGRLHQLDWPCNG